MRIPGWLKAHRRQGIAHMLTVCGFLLFLVLAAGPLFDIFEARSGISMLQDISLPGETDNIIWRLDRHTRDTSTIQLDGWAFIEGDCAENKETFIALKSDDRVYVFDTVERRRGDIAQHFDSVGLEWSGFHALIPYPRIKRGEYSVGVYIRGDDTEALVVTDWVLSISAGGVSLASRTLNLEGTPLSE